MAECRSGVCLRRIRVVEVLVGTFDWLVVGSGWSIYCEPPRMLLCFANRVSRGVGEPLLVSGGELVVVVEASFE